eukprot:scaffold16767_cov57-Phaeocystis_antarctica.AAC.5
MGARGAERLKVSVTSVAAVRNEAPPPTWSGILKAAVLPAGMVKGEEVRMPLGEDDMVTVTPAAAATASCTVASSNGGHTPG